jgi:replicative DNA helicase
MNTTIERQKAILGTLAINPSAYIEVAEIVQPYMFQDGVLQNIAHVIWDYSRDGKPYDTATLEKAARADQVQALIDQATGRDVLAEHAEAVRNAYYAEQHTKFQNEMSAAILEGADYFRAKAEYQTKVEAMLLDNRIKSTKAERIKAAHEAVIRAINDPNSISGIATPYQHLNNFTAGWQKGDYTIVGARPGMGKTTFLCEQALAAVQNGEPCAIFSMGDLTSEQMYMKLACLMAGLAMKRVRTGNIDEDEARLFYDQLEMLYDYPIEVIDLKDCDNRIGAITDRIRIGVEKYGWQMVIIDYVQQLRPNTASLTGNQAYEQISQQIQKVTKSNGITTLAASQLNRAVESRGGSKRPSMADLRSSGAFEQDADNILFLYRPGYYGIEEDEEGCSIKYRTEVIFEKYRIAGDEIPATFNLEWKKQRLIEEKDGYNSDSHPMPSTEEVGPEVYSNVISKKANTDEDVPF